MSILNTLQPWVWPLTGGVALGLGYAATISLGVSQATTAGANVSHAKKNGLSDDEIKVLVAKNVAKQAYRTVSISFLRFALCAALLVWLGQATTTASNNTVTQTGLATVGLVLGLVLGLIASLGFTAIRGSAFGGTTSAKQ